ncbi:Rv1733c family protein [Streptomyces sp. enrichment culture]|uniref:Rv1733c family protein n=1 Tax=Streptomyces sp. enrichment culture TaxID=1795815 RepID=UPI003F575135
MRQTPRRKAAPVRLWRWRSNPLRRRSDRVEAWIVLAGWVLAVLCGAVAALAAATAVDGSLSAQRAQTRAVPAVLTERAPRTPQVTTDGSGGDTVWATVRWTAPDGSPHTGRTEVEPEAAAGTRVTVWTDRAGRLAAAPLSPTESRFQAVGTGVLAGAGAGAAVWVCGRLARLRLDRRRLQRWDAEWARVGPQWRKRMTG